jgi:hypothetical protein
VESQEKQVPEGLRHKLPARDQFPILAVATTKKTKGCNAFHASFFYGNLNATAVLYAAGFGGRGWTASK